MRILLVEDDESVAKVLQKVLTDEHYAVDVATDGHIGWQMVSASHYDLIVLDVLLPKLDGLAFCQQLRERAYNMPVLLVTALDSSTKKIAGLNAGADDYITKPFELEELLARVRALLRRVQTCVFLTLDWGKLRLEVNSREVIYGENSLNLTPKEYALLELFLRNSSQVFSRRAILDNLWSFSEAPGEETVTSHMKGLRRKLSKAGAPADFIETVYGVGYRLNPIMPEVAAKAPQIQANQDAAQSNLETTRPRAGEPKKANAKAINSKAIDLKAAQMRQQKTKAALATLWNSVKFQQRTRLERLQNLLQQLKTNSLSDEVRSSAYRAAHGLTGVLGIFGLTLGSDLAREIQGLLRGEAPLTPQEQVQLQTLIGKLDQILEQAIHVPTTMPETDRMPLLVLLDPLLNLTPALVPLLWQKGITVKISPHLSASRTLFMALSHAQAKTQSHQSSEKNVMPDSIVPNSIVPDVVLLNFSFQDADSTQFAELSHLVKQIPTLMLLICSAEGDLESRVKASQLGSYPFLYYPNATGVAKGIELLRSHPQTLTRKILAVDDDPQVLAALRSRLENQGFQITTLNEPLKFWETLEKVSPDLLLLDISMPEFSGIELCQAVRQAPFWSHLPIVFFTSYANAQVQQAAFRAGADNLVEKSSPYLDLLSHLYEQIKRSHLQQAIAEIADGTIAASP
ncbi:MAG: response regulator [Phormidesmis sp. RL_2_1]|nr:response regulator [Phormidesmis sp. RL_2_1]